MKVLAMYWHAPYVPCDYLPEFPLRYHVEIQELLTRSGLLAAVGLAAQNENPLAEIDWPMAVSCSLDSLH